MIVGIASKPTDRALDRARGTIEFLQSKGHEIRVDESTMEELDGSGVRASSKSDIASGADLLITF
ncbi:MAG: hypothetical protein R3338_10810, partial [Thermoanaerobaculia bacterium]|nr:hypothetical protein [Thermoanaerobaculia bacterium]